MSRGRYEYRVKEIRWLFWIAVGCFAAHAISYLLMPAAMRTFENNGSKGSRMLVGCIFWLPLLLGYILVILANLERKTFIRSRRDGDISMQCHMGVITFFSKYSGSYCRCCTAGRKHCTGNYLFLRRGKSIHYLCNAGDCKFLIKYARAV